MSDVGPHDDVFSVAVVVPMSLCEFLRQEAAELEDHDAEVNLKEVVEGDSLGCDPVTGSDLVLAVIKVTGSLALNVAGGLIACVLKEWWDNRATSRENGHMLTELIDESGYSAEIRSDEPHDKEAIVMRLQLRSEH